MNKPTRTLSSLVLLQIASSLCFGPARGQADDWPQWRGPNRDGKATGFNTPKTWPKELTQKWKVTVGKGDATPALVGNKLYVFARDDAGEITVCLDAATGKDLWRDSYDALAATGPASRHPGPRSSPAVAGGKIVAYGVRGTLSCLDAATGKVLWRKNDPAGALPRFFTSSSPMILDGVCIALLGGEEKGGIAAYDLATGDQKWMWTDDGTAYASPALLTVAGTRMAVALTAKKIVGIGLADGKLLWDAPFAAAGRAYNAATPVVDGATVICAGSGRGAKALKIEKTDGGFAAKELWSNPDNAVQFNTPVLKGGQLYGISQKGDLFCLSAQDGKTLWTAPLGSRDFGSVVDAGSVLFALTTQGDLTVFEPGDKGFKKLASYKVASTDTYAHPVVTGNGLYMKDADSLTFWALE